MTQEEVMIWITKLMLACMWIIALCVTIVGVGFSAGYLTETYANYRAAKCMNSACTDPCKPNARFVRHQGCVK